MTIREGRKEVRKEGRERGRRRRRRRRRRIQAGQLFTMVLTLSYCFKYLRPYVEILLRSISPFTEFLEPWRCPKNWSFLAPNSLSVKDSFSIGISD